MAHTPASQAAGERGPLQHDHIVQAVAASNDQGQTLDFSHKNITEIQDDATHELATIGRDDDDDEGCVTRIALVFNFLTTLPPSFALITRLRYLNLRSNGFTIFPDVLCNMPSLEILDISRNKLKRLPTRSGTLKNLRVFSFTKNKIDRIPSYFSEFSRLRMLKIDHNPIEWPPMNVIRRTQDGDEGMETWIHELQEWLRNHELAQQVAPNGIAKVAQPDMNTAGDEDTPRSASRAANGTSSVTHSRAPSDESMTSARHFAQPVPLPDLSGESPYQNFTPQFGNSNGLSVGSIPADDFMNSHRDDSVLSNGTVHGRNASTSFMGQRSGSASSGLFAKKSLPDLRNAQLHSYSRSQPRRSDMRKVSEEPALPSLSSMNQPLRDSSGQQSRPSTSSNRSIVASSSGSQVPIEAERHSYFKRYSTLPSSSVSKTIPDSMLKTVDAIRGIFFAVGQMHSAIQHYTIFGTDERQSSGVLGRLMNGASDYMLKLMGALDRFDSLSRRGLPPPSVCKDLVEACRDNVAISIKVVGVLNAQLKVLAGTDDLRFARTSLLMLYGAMAEVSNSWHALAPHLEAIQPLLQEYRPPPIARSGSAMASRSNITPIAESPSSPPRSARLPPNASASNKPLTRGNRRNGGSFSFKDVQIGRSLAASSSPMIGSDNSLSSAASSSSTVTAVNSNSAALKSVLRNPLGSNANGSSQSLASSSSNGPSQQVSSSSLGSSHSRENSVNATPAPNAPRATPIPPTVNNRLQPLARSRTSDLPGSAQMVDRDLLATMDAACDTASATWNTIEQEPFKDDASYAHLKDVVDKARVISTTLKQDIESIRGGYSESDKKSLWDNANHFAKIITQVAMLLKPHTAHISSILRSQIEKLINSTKEFTILLSVSSFAPVSASRSFSPAFGGPNADPSRGLGNAAFLGRSRSATATQDAAPRPPQMPHKEVPWSAMPHQSFKVPNLPPSSLSNQRFDEDDERPQRRI